MTHQRIRITGLVAVALAVAVATPAAMGMPIGGTGRGLALPAVPTSLVAGLNPIHQAPATVRPNPDQQVPAAHAALTPRYVPAAVAIRPNPDQQVPLVHATPSSAVPTGHAARGPRVAAGNGFDWVALAAGIGTLLVLGLGALALRSISERTRHPRRGRVAASS